MATTYKILGRAVGTVAGATLYTVSSTASAIVTTIAAANTTGLDVPGSVYISPTSSDGSYWAAGAGIGSLTGNGSTGVVYALGDFYAAAVGGVRKATITVSTTSGASITWSTAVSTSVGLADIVYGDKLVAVGIEGYVATSTDAVTWTTSKGPITSTNLNAITYGNGIYVAVGDSGYLRTSTNGTAWNSQTSNFGTTNIFAVGYGNGLYLAGGASGTLRTSTDAVTWTTQSSGTVQNITAFYYNDGLYLMGAGSSIHTSTDTVTWTSRSTAGGYSFVYNNGKYYAGTGTGNIGISTDGISWNFKDGTMGSFTGGIAYGNGTYVATAKDGSTAVSNSLSTAPLSVSNALMYQTTIPANSTVNLTLGLALSPGSRVYVGAGTASSLTFHAFGSEIS